MNKKLATILVLFVATSLSAQTQKPKSWVATTFDKIFNDTASSADPKFVAYPTLAYSPETRWEFGASALYVYYANRDITNRLSEVSAFTFFTLEKQYGLWLDHALYSDQSTWFLLGKIRLQQFPLLYYGIGSDTPSEEIAQVNGVGVSIRERVLRQLKGSLYLGVELDYNRLSNTEFIAHDDAPPLLSLPIGSGGSTNYGVGVGLVYDNRHNVLNVREGFFGEMGFLHYNDSWGSDFSYTNYFLDLRYYLPTTKTQVLAAQLFTNTVAPSKGSGVPFNQLALMGGENLMRGYYLGRYRDNALMATQVEYRFLPFPFSKRLGGAAFISAGGVSPSLGEVSLKDWVVAGGAGLRFLLFPAKDIFTRFDVAATQEGLGYYFFIGEAF